MDEGMDEGKNEEITGSKGRMGEMFGPTTSPEQKKIGRREVLQPFIPFRKRNEEEGKMGRKKKKKTTTQFPPTDLSGEDFPLSCPDVRSHSDDGDGRTHASTVGREETNPSPASLDAVSCSDETRD